MTCQHERGGEHVLPNGVVIVVGVHTCWKCRDYDPEGCERHAVLTCLGVEARSSLKEGPADRELAEAARMHEWLREVDAVQAPGIVEWCCRYELLASESRTVGLECSYHSDPAACVCEV